MNLTNLASKRYNGLVHDNSIGVESAPNNKGFTVTTKKRKLVVSKLCFEYYSTLNGFIFKPVYVAIDSYLNDR